jgi:hippurate hydrolase
MPVINRIAEFHDDMTAWRRDFHAHPELALEEHRTSAIVQQKLREFGVDEIHTGLAGTGVVGVIRGEPAAGATPAAMAIGLRADMDALPITEETGAPYASTVPGKMHACGHDGHTAMLLGAARYLAETRNFRGSVHLIFQPAEERYGGGGIMVREGLFDRFPCDRVFALHNWPRLPAGTFAWRDGPMLAAVATIEITVHGTGSHAAQPHLGVDPIVAAAQIVSALQSVISRNRDPVHSGVVTIGAIAGGDIHNVIPQSVRMLGTARWFDPAAGDAIEAGVRRVVEGVAAAMGARAELRYERTYPATVNDPGSNRLAATAAASVVGETRVEEFPAPVMGGEDFSFMLRERPGAFLVLGSGRGGDDANPHHPRFDFNDAVLPIGASWFARLAETLLPRQG